MSKYILVKTPLTSDGNMPLIGIDGKQVYSESILGFAAKEILEKRNSTLPGPLKVLIEGYDGEIGVKPAGEQPVIIPTINLKAENQKIQEENEKLKQQLSELQQKPPSKNKAVATA